MTFPARHDRSRNRHQMTGHHVGYQQLIGAEVVFVLTVVPDVRLPVPCVRLVLGVRRDQQRADSDGCATVPDG
jgi:hypothetical protein